MTCPVSGLSDRDIDYTYIRDSQRARVEYLPNLRYTLHGRDNSPPPLTIMLELELIAVRVREARSTGARRRIWFKLFSRA